MLIAAESTVYERTKAAYIARVPRFTIGHLIAAARKDRGWNQQRLGEKAAKFHLSRQTKPINKATVSKVERDPYGSKFGTIWRLLAALDLTLCDAEREVGNLLHQPLEETGIQRRHAGERPRPIPSGRASSS